MSSHSPRIAIIGAGPAGLTAGVLLHRHNIPFTMFEYRQKPTPQELAQPSGMLDLHEETGLAALRKCDLFDAFLPLTGDCAEVMRIADKEGNIVFTQGGGDGGDEQRPEISRHALNQLLMSALTAESIKWGYKLHIATHRSTKDNHTEFELDFGPNHSHQTFDLVIGADGAWSKVRQLLTDVTPLYAGRQIVTLTIRQITKHYPHIVELIGPGTFFALGNRHGVTAQRGPQDSARIYIFITTPDEDFARTSGLGTETAADVKRRLLDDDKLLGQWGARTKELIEVACDEEAAHHPDEKVNIRPVCGLPIEHAWKHKQGAMLIGDAAHLMPPSGEGVNIGMWDAVKVCQAIIKAHKTAQDGTSFQSALDPLMEEVEVDMAERAKGEAEQSRMLSKALFAEDGPAAMVKFFESFAPPPLALES